MLPASGVTCQLEPDDDAYCTDQPSRLTALVPLLCNSMKSLFQVAPELPPPPYTWLITTCACAAPKPQDNSKASASRRAYLFIETPLSSSECPVCRTRPPATSARLCRRPMAAA